MSNPVSPGPFPSASDPLEGLLEDGTSDDELKEAAAQEARVSDDRLLGRPGPPLDRRTPFFIGLSGALGVGAAFVLAWAVFMTRGLLLLFTMSLFLAAGLDPIVVWLHKRGLPRWAGVLVVVLAGLAALGGILGLLVPVVVHQVTQLVNHLPHYAKELSDRSSFLGKLNSHYHIETNIKNALTSRSSSIATGVFGVGKLIFGAVADLVIFTVVSIYLLADLPRVKRGIWLAVPRSRRARAIVIGEEIFGKVGGYVLGKLAMSLITGIGTLIWAAALGIPYPLLLGVVVAVLDLVPVVGSTIGGFVVALVGLTVSVVVAAATVGFYLLYRGIEDYILSPRIMRRAVQVPGLATVISTLIGATLFGIIGALIAIPVTAAVQLLLQELAVPHLDRS